MDPDAVRGLLELTTERELVTIVLAAAVSGALTFALAWRILGTGRDVQLRQLDSLDKTVARLGDEPSSETKEQS